jgi:hypothetical protein
LTDLKIADWNVRFIRSDNAGKNMTMKNDPDIKSFGVKFEFSGPRTPQRNGKVEKKFQTLYGRIWSTLNGSGLESELRDKIWAEEVMNVLICQSWSGSYKRKNSGLVEQPRNSLHICWIHGASIKGCVHDAKFDHKLDS